jgi:hypothetical protein
VRQVRDKNFDRSRGISKRTPVAAAMVVAALVALSVASPAMASLQQDMQRFANCPYTNPIATHCLYAVVTSGEFKIGNSTTPITKPVTIQGGLTPPVLVPATNGETLSKTAEPVPGGLTGTENELPGGLGEITATAELAGTGELGETVHLPLKVKLSNVTLGNECYIGSEAEPLTLNLIYGTTNPPPPNKPISGKGTVTVKDNGLIQVVTGTLVDNAFAAPAANGCNGAAALVNAKEGLPAAAGTNTAIQTGSTELTTSELVRNVLPLPDIGRCVKVVGPATNEYGNASCTEESPGQGKFEWTEGPGPNPKFTGATTAVKLESVGHTLVTCIAGTDEGEYTGAKTESVSYKLTGCQTGPKGKGTPCQSSAAAAEEIDTAALKGTLEFIKENEGTVKPVVGVDLQPASGSQVAAFECGGQAFSVGGSVIAPITSVDTMTTASKVTAKASQGKQAYEAFEVGPKDTLTLAAGGGGEVQAGLTTTDKRIGEEKLEIRALP